MTRPLLAAGLAFWMGSTVLLSLTPWAQRRRLADRLAPHLASGGRQPSPQARRATSLRDMVGPLAQSVGGRLSRVLGVDEDLSLRLRRMHDPRDPAEVRIRQLGLAAAVTAIAAASAAALGPGPATTVALVGSAPVATLLVLEHRMSAESSRWKRRVSLELPVVAEQLGMLLSAGYSLGSAIERLARRGSGAVAADLRRVCERRRQGLSEMQALAEWAELARVDAVDRLVAVLALNREAADLGGLVSEEARAVRRDLHRHLLETIERRGQQVWIPVTVATLVPGVIFLVVPFAHAMTFFAAS